MRKNAFESWRDDVLQDIWDFQLVMNWKSSHLANHAKLASSTVYKLRNGSTKEPRASTIFKLAKSLGLDVNVQETQKPRLKLRRA